MQPSNPTVIPTRREVIESARKQNKKIAAVLPYHFPRALLRAHGIHPVEVWNPPRTNASNGNRHFQAYACALIHHTASFLLDQPAGTIDLALMPHNCDALQGMASVLRDFTSAPFPVLTLYLPKGRRESDIAFLVEELRRLSGRLAEITGRAPSETELCEAVAVESSADDAFAGACDNRARFNLSDRDFYTALRSREYLPPGQFQDLIRGLPVGTAASTSPRVPLLLSGIIPEPMDLFDKLNEMGAAVVADDLACGSRRAYRTPHNGIRDPLEQMARSLVGAPPDPITGAPIPLRIEHLLTRLRSSGARGMLIYDVKFCEPEQFDLPQLRDAVTAAGYPLLYIEHELGRSLSAQTITRMEAFVEMLG